jgi:GNAT superfamily N-acetyltransferase
LSDSLSLHHALPLSETQQGLERLSILQHTTLPQSPEQNGKQEAFWTLVEGRLMAMLEGEPELTLELLNRATQAWVEQEYHRRVHSETGQTPIDRCLSGTSVVRPCPSSDALRRAFRMEVRRKQRLSDGTITVDGVRFELPAAYRTLLWVSVRVVELIKKAGFDAEFCLLLPPRWRETPELRAAGEARVGVAQRAGMQPFVERLRYLWTPSCGLPDRPGRLTFRPEPDDDVIFDVLRRIAHGSLDVHDQRAMEKGGADEAARTGMEFLQWMPSPREWWRLAYTQSGDLVGLTVPGRNYTAPVIGVVGVVPEHRGNGYAYDLLIEATHLLAAEGVEEIVAETDTTNTPMAATFARAGYPITQERVYLK